MGVIARRLQDTGEAWRHVYKSLLLLEYMLKHGPQKVRLGAFRADAANHAYSARALALLNPDQHPAPSLDGGSAL